MCAVYVCVYYTVITWHLSVAHIATRIALAILVYLQVSDQLSRARQQARGPAVGGTSVVRRLKRERDDAQMETRQLRAESKSLKTRLKSLQDSQHADLRSIEDRCSELQLQLDDVRAYFSSVCTLKLMYNRRSVGVVT